MCLDPKDTCYGNSLKSCVFNFLKVKILLFPIQNFHFEFLNMYPKDIC
jgi:hypothetical protein